MMSSSPVFRSSQRIARVAAFAGAITVLAVVASSVVPVAADPGDGPLALPPAAPAEAHVVTLSEPTADLARTVLGDRFVELWMADDQAHFMVGVLDLDPVEVEALTAQLGAVAPVELVRREVSRAELDLVVSETLDALGATPGASVAPDYTTGAVFVTLPPGDADAAVAAIGAAVDAEVLEVAAADVATVGELDLAASADPLVVVSRSEVQAKESQVSDPLRGGKKVTLNNGSSYCTASFIVKRGNDHFQMMAGHCGGDGATVKLGSVTGVTESNTLTPPFTNADAMVFKLPSGLRPTPSVYIADGPGSEGFY
ncbi:MAG: S1 family peptidase, partial [Propionibacteriaceae bacterium]|nr:S1 family peptidase [Propionibacteriaceae bacterium]